MQDKLNIQLNVNGESYNVAVRSNSTLLYVLREELHLMGTKFGCGTGDCGACKVLLGDEAVNSCTVLARNVNGQPVTTIEGLSAPNSLSPVQRAFIDAGAIQCGFCTPGMIITATALLRKNPGPTDGEIIHALDNNLCRCTGYIKIVDAVHLAARYLEEEAGK